MRLKVKLLNGEETELTAPSEWEVMGNTRRYAWLDKQTAGLWWMVEVIS